MFRHAGATSVKYVEPTELPPGLTAPIRGGALVRVRDNGRGLDPDHRLGLGLTGMRERILALGGTLTIASGDGGVTVEADDSQRRSLLLIRELFREVFAKRLP